MNGLFVCISLVLGAFMGQVDAAYRCGGPLISNCHILTANHCINENGTVKLEAYTSHHQSKFGKTFAFVDIDYTIKHPLRATGHRLYNMGIITLKKCVDASVFTVLSLADAGTTVTEGKELKTLGFGWNPPPHVPRIIHQSEIPYVSRANCNTTQSEPVEITEDIICDGGDSFESACGGDSGGLLVNMTAPAGPTLVGVSSFGAGHCNQSSGLDSPSGFTSVGNVVDWIVHEVCKDERVDPNLRIVNETAASVNGGVYVKYYSGSWAEVPNFDNLSPYMTDVVSEINYVWATSSFATSGMSNQVGAVFEGRVRFPSSGEWKLCIRSMYLSQLFVDNFLFIDNPHNLDNGYNTMNEMCANVYVDVDSVRIVQANYMQEYLYSGLVVDWEGPQQAKQPIPASAWTNAPVRPSTLISVKYYEGRWNELPDFQLLSPFKTDNVSTINFPGSAGEFATSGKYERVGAVFEGSVLFPQPGKWKICTTSDAGSQAFVNDLLIVDNGGVHSMQKKCGAYTVIGNTVHAVKITYFKQFGHGGLIVHWEGPGTAVQVMPPFAWTYAPLSPRGITVKYYYTGHNIRLVSDFEHRTPYKTDVVKMLYFKDEERVNFATSGKHTYVGALFEGRVLFPSSGNWKICLGSDDGSKLYFDNALLIDNDGTHPHREKCAEVYASANSIHIVKTFYFESGGAASLMVSWEGPNKATEWIPADAWL